MKSPLCIAVNEETNRIYVGANQSIIVIDGETDETVSEISLDFRVEFLTVNPQTNRVYASGGDTPFDNATYVIDGSTGSMVRYIGGGNRAEYQREMAINPATNLVYIADPSSIQGRSDYVKVYDGGDSQE